MDNHNLNQEVHPHPGKPVDEFADDAIKGNEVLGGGKGTIILPTVDVDGVVTDETQPVDDGTVSFVDDGSVPVV